MYCTYAVGFNPDVQKSSEVSQVDAFGISAQNYINSSVAQQV